MTTTELQPEKPPFSLRRTALNLFLALLDVSALSLMAFLALALMPQRHWAVEMFANMLHWMLLAAIPALLLMLALRRWRRAALWAIPSLAFFALFGGLLLPAVPAQASDASTSLRVMTYNTLGESRGDMQLQVDLIRRYDADIVAFQELSPETAAAIEAQLADLYPYRALYPDGIPGTGLLSKYPLSNIEPFYLNQSALQHIKATVDLAGTPVTVISAHPPPPGLMQMRYTTRGSDEIAALVDLATQGGPTLLIGDFNITDQASDYRIIKQAGLHDAYREAGWGFGATWPARLRHEDQPSPPLIRLDYIFYTDEFHAISAQVGPWALSDHRPVIADLIFTP